MLTLSKTVTKVLQADPTAVTLLEALRQQPADDSTASALSDRLQEVGVKPVSAKRYVVAVRLRRQPVWQWPEEARKWLLKGTTADAIQTALDAANGRRKVRTLTLSECLETCREARMTGWGAAAGGTVANSYGYPATQTGFVAAVGKSGRLRWAVGEVPASKGTSVTNRLAGLTSRATAEDWQRWADAVEVPETV